MIEYTEYRLGDLCKRFSSGKSISADFITESGEYPVIGGNGLRGYTGTFNFDGECAVIGRQGAYCGNVQYFSGKGYMTEHAIVTEPNKMNNAKYLSYKLGSLSLGRFSGQAAQPGLSVTKLARLRLEMPSKQYQDRVANTLFTYDNLIEINNKRIKLLEQMAENLYKEWFVRFRFPGYETAEFEESGIGKIPTFFTLVKMVDIFDFYIGGGWGNDDENSEYSVPAFVIRGTDFPHVAKGDISTCPLRYHKAGNYYSRRLKAGDIILEVSGGTAEQPVGRTLYVNQDTIDRLGGRVICASFCKLIRVKTDRISPLCFYYWMQFLYETRIIDRFQLQSTGIVNFQFEYFLRKGEVLIPPDELMRKFDLSVSLIQNEISSISKQNENLIKQRDLLLPRLMSGKLEV